MGGDGVSAALQVLAHEYLLNATDAQLAFFRMSDVALGAAPSSRS